MSHFPGKKNRSHVSQLTDFNKGKSYTGTLSAELVADCRQSESTRSFSEHHQGGNAMKSRIMRVCVVQLTLISLLAAQAQPEPDLKLQNNITFEYVLYLADSASSWQAQVAPGVAGNDAATMKAHMGLAILAFAWSHVDGDTMVTDLEPIFDDLADNLDSLAGQFDDYILPILSADNMDSLFAELIRFFDSGDYAVFRDSVTNYLDYIGSNFSDGGDILDNWFSDVEENFADSSFQDHIDSVRTGIADFQFALQVIGSGYDTSLFVFDRTFFNRLDSLDVITSAMDEAFEGAGNQFDAVIDITGGDIMPAVDSLRLALDKLTEAVDTLKVIITNDPFTPFNINPEGLDSMKVAIAELDTLLGGKLYDLGPSIEGKTIKPLAIIQSMPGDSLWKLLEGFYRAHDPTVYTFGGIVPDGLPIDGLEILAADAILNSEDDADSLNSRLQVLEDGWRADLADYHPDPDAHFGLALFLAY